MATNPQLTFAEAVAFINADDTGLVNGLRAGEQKVTQAVGRMQQRLDKLSSGFRNLGSTASGALALVAANAAQADSQMGRFVASAAAGAAATIALGSALGPLGVALGVVGTAFSLLIRELPKYTKEADLATRASERLAAAQAEMERKTAEVVKLNEKLRELRGDRETSARALALRQEMRREEGRLRFLKEQKAFATQLRREQSRARVGSFDRSRFGTAAEIVQRQEDSFLHAGPQTIDDALKVARDVARTALSQERAAKVLGDVVKELGPAQAELVRQRFPQFFPRSETEAETSRTGQVGFRRADRFGGLGGGAVAIDLDKSRNTLLDAINENLKAQNTLLRQSGGLN